MLGGNEVFRREMPWWAEMTSFVRSYMRGARFLFFFPSSNKFNGFHIYNTLVSQIPNEKLGYFRQLPPFPSRLRTASTGRPSLAVLRHVGGGHGDTGDVVDTGDISNSVQLYTAHAL